MTQMADVLKSQVLRGLAKPKDQGGLGTAWWFNSYGGEFGVNHFEDGVPHDLAEALIRKSAPMPRKIAVMCEDGVTVDFVSQEHIAALIEDYSDGNNPKNISYIGSNGFGIHDPIKLLWNPMKELCVNGVEILSVVVSRNGALVSIQLTSPQTTKTASCGMQFTPSLFAGTAHDGSMSSWFKDTAVITECDNTVAWALSKQGKHELKIKHTAKSEAGLKATVDEVWTRLEEIGEAMGYKVDGLASIKVSEKDFFKWLDVFAPEPEEFLTDQRTLKERRNRAFAIVRKKRNDLVEMYRQDRRCAPWQGTALGVVQTVNTFGNHMSPVRGADRVTRQMDNLWSGKQEALDGLALKQLQAVLA